jgi:hypothetical protein
MPLAYRQVKDLYDTLREVGVTDKPLPEWSAEMNTLTNSDLYSSGLHDNLIKRSSVAIDRLLEKTGLPELGREFGRGIGEAVGAGEAGAEIGQSLPRSTLNFAPLFIPGVGWGAAAARLGLTGLLSGAETYTSTGSPAAGTISGLTAAALPGATNRIEQFAARKLGSKAGTFAAGQIGAAGIMEGSKAATNLVTGEDQVNPFSVENLLNLTLGQVPFAAIHGARKLIEKKGPTAGELQHAIDVSTPLIEQKRAADRAAKSGDINALPNVERTDVSPQIIKETQTRLAQIRGEQVTIKDDATLTPDQKFEATNSLLREETDLMRQREGVEPSARSVFGDSIVEDSPRQQVVGHELRSTDKWRAILVDDIPVNPPELRGKVVSYSTAYEPNPTRRSTGDSVYGLPEKQWRTVKTQEEWHGKMHDPLQPDLPVQPEEASRAKMFAHLEDLKKVEISADAAKTPLDFQQAVVRLQDVEHQNGLQPTSDAELRREATTLEKEGTTNPQDIPKVAVKVRAKKVARRLQEREVPPLSPEEAATVSAQMGAGGFSVITADKLSHNEPSTTPFGDLVTEKAYGVTHGDLATKPEDVNMFRTLVEHLGTLPEPRMYEEISDVAKFIAERDGITVAEAKDEVNHFITQPHVQEWGKRLDEQIAKLRETNAAPAQPNVPAGDNWLFSMGHYDPTTNTLNFKHRLPKDGKLVVEQFRNMAGVGKPLAKAEVELYQSLVPEVFEGGKVNVPKLVEGLKTKGPVVETKVLGGEASGSIATRERDQLRHTWYDTLPENVRSSIDKYASEYVDDPTSADTSSWLNQAAEDVKESGATQNTVADFRRSAQRWVELQNLDYEHPGAPQYSFLGPKPESEMPGYVEGLVRVPKQKGFESTIPESSDAKQAGIKYHGPHFGSEDTNVLSFYRGYEETLPDGTKAFHVIEVQSDWGQRAREERPIQETKGEGKGRWYIKGYGGETLFDTPEAATAANTNRVADHPLLRVYESLALKAAIAHAKEIGATKVILPDAETAMMTEGHDRLIGDIQNTLELANDNVEQVYDPFLVKQGTGIPKEELQRREIEGLERKYRSVGKIEFAIKNGEIVTTSIEPLQAKGMRLHYDQTLPSAMEKLTGEKGVEGVGLGEHKNGPSPVFKTSADIPKWQITGRLYDISHLPGDFTLTDPNRAPGWTSIEPESERDASLMTKVGTDGNSGLKFLTDMGEVPTFKALATDLSKFTDSLGRIDLSIGKTDTGTSFARDLGNGRVRVVISDAAMNNRSTFEFHVLHEIAHGLSLVELNNPTKIGIRNEIEGIRQRLLETLPTKLKDQMGFLERTQWLEQYKAGQASFNSILPDGTDAQRAVLYALSSTNEFVAQGLSSRATIEYMKGVKTKKGNWFSRFTNTIKQLLGVGDKIPNNVFEEFLSKTDQLLDRGNYVSSFRNFSDRYFENLGQSEGEVSANTRRATGVLLNNRFDTTARDILYQLADTNLIRSSDVGMVQRDVTQMFNQKEQHPHYEETAKVLDELGLEASPQGLNDLTHASLIDEMPNHEDAIDLLPATAQRYLFAKLTDMQNVLGVLKAASDEKNIGLLNIADPKMLAGPVAQASKMLDRMLSIKQEWEQSEQSVQRMGSIAPDAFLDHAVSAPFEPEHAPVAEAFGNESLKKQKKGIGWFLNPVAQLARSNPLTSELITRGFELEPAARQYFGNITKVLGIDLTGDKSQIDKETSKQAIKVIQNSRTQKAIDSWMAENQLRARTEKRGVTLLSQTDEKVQGFLKNLTDKERQGVIDTVSRAGAMTVLGQNSALNYMAKIASTSGAAIAIKDQPMKASQAVELTSQLFDAVNADRTDPAKAQVADAKMSLVQSKMTPEGFLSLLKFTQTQTQKWQAWQEYFQQNPGWVTAQRQEKFLVSFTRGGKKYQLQASSTKEAKVIAEGGANLKITDNWKGRNDEFPVLGPDAPELMTRLQELDANAKQIMSQAGLTPEQMDAYDKASPVTQFAREAGATGGGIPEFRTPPRLLSQGAEELPFLWNHISWAQRQSNYWTRQLFRAQAELHLSDPELATRPDLQKLLRTHVDNILQPDPAIIQKINRFTSTWFMGFAPASAVVNGMQTLSTLVPELTNVNGGRAIKSYSTWKSAVADVIAHTATGRGKQWKDPELDNLMRQAERAGQVGFSMWDETAQAHEQIATNWKRALMKNKPQDLGQRLNTFAGSWSTAAMWMFKNVEMFNQRVALVAGYKTYREMGQTHDEAVQSSFGLNQAVNYGGGRAGRPIGLYSGRDTFTRGAAMLASNMQNYNLGVIGQLSRYLQAGFFRPEGITPAEVFASRKAATQMLGTQLAAAGLLGLPFASGMVAVLNQFFPSLEINKKLREYVADFFGSDHDNGNVLGDAAMTGLPSMLGWDMQSRLSMGNVTPGVSEYNGFQPGLLLGPPANLVSTFVNGLARVVQGEPQGAEAFIPPGLKKLTQFIANEGQLKDYRDRPIFKPTTGESVGIALGFNPKRLSDFNAASKIVDQSQTVSNRRAGQEHQQLAEEVLKGNFGTVRQSLLSKAQTDTNYDPREGVRAIARSAEDLTFPRDLRREGTLNTSAARGRLLNALNISPSSGASEVDRLKFRQEIERRLGVVPSSNQELATAMLMDQLKAKYPEASRVELRNRAGQLLHVRNSQLLPE